MPDHIVCHNPAAETSFFSVLVGSRPLSEVSCPFSPNEGIKNKEDEKSVLALVIFVQHMNRKRPSEWLRAKGAEVSSRRESFPPTILLQHMRNQTLQKLILPVQAPLKVQNLRHYTFIISFQGLNASRDLFLRLKEPENLPLNGIEGGWSEREHARRSCDRGLADGIGKLALRGNFPFDTFEDVWSACTKVGVTEGPALGKVISEREIK